MMRVPQMKFHSTDHTFFFVDQYDLSNCAQEQNSGSILTSTSPFEAFLFACPPQLKNYEDP